MSLKWKSPKMVLKRVKMESVMVEKSLICVRKRK